MTRFLADALAVLVLLAFAALALGVMAFAEVQP